MVLKAKHEFMFLRNIYNTCSIAGEFGNKFVSRVIVVVGGIHVFSECYKRCNTHSVW